LDNAENVVECFKGCTVIIGGFLVGLLGGWDIALKVLLIFVIADYLTGLSAAWYQKTINSEVGLKGIIKKFCLFIPVGIGFWLDSLTGTEFLRSLAIFFYIANEGISILENLGKMNIPIPSAMKDALTQIKDKKVGK
jgi:toxin secretion/phage lysis holin